MKNIIILFMLLSVNHMVAQEPNEDVKKMYHQFDFWLGNWDVYKFATDTLVGESRVETIIDSVGLLENYKTTQGKYQGKSLNKYNPVKKQWEQYWIDNSGLTLYLAGSIIDQKMVLIDLQSGDSKNGFNKIIWEKLNENTVRQTWSVSNDNGTTWAVVFDGEYKRKSQ